MKHTRWILISVVAVVLGSLTGADINGFLAISMADRDTAVTTTATTTATTAETTTATSATPASRPPLALRMVDLGGVGIEVDPTDWGNSYSHNTRRFERALLRDSPFIDSTEAVRVYREFDFYVARMADMGYNAIEFSGFLEFVGFDSIGDGLDVYPIGSPYRDLQRAMRTFHQPMFDSAARHGMDVYLRTDMMALSDPLERYLKQRFGSLDAANPELWEVYASALVELFDTIPQVKGLIIRIGEAGAVYNREGAGYRSVLAVRESAQVQRMLRAFLAAAESRDRTIVFRSWTVGVGDIGDLHTNPETYHRVLEPIDSPNLIVSTKIYEGDFWPHLPLNRTLFFGSHRRIVELQARREFEGFNVFPDFIGTLYGDGIRAFVESNEHVEGVWVWTQGGGPLRKGPMMTYPFAGTWIWTDANVYAASRIALNPAVSPQEMARSWTRRSFEPTPVAERALVSLLMESHKTAADGLTVPGFAAKRVRGLGLEIPPVIYSYWDIVDGSSAVGAHIYVAAKAQLDRELASLDEPTTQVAQMAADLEAAVPGLKNGRRWIPAMRASIAYEQNLFATLAFHKRFVLGFQRWLDRGGDDGTWRAAMSSFETALVSHRARYDGSRDYPAYNFELAERSISQAKRITWLMWLARVLVLAGLALLWIPNRLLFAFASVWIAACVVLLGAGSAPVFSVSLSVALIGYGVGLRTVCDDRVYRRATLPLVLWMLLIMIVVAMRGPQFVWFLVWTSDVFRLVATISAVGLLLAHALMLWDESTARARRIGGTVLTMGLLTTAVGCTIALVGFEHTLTALNEELLLLPGMLSRVLGIVTHLSIPESLPVGVAVFGSGLLLAGALLLAYSRSGNSSLDGTVELNSAANWRQSISVRSHNSPRSVS